MADVSKLPDTAVVPSAEIASARTGPPWPRNCACAGPTSSNTTNANEILVIGRLHTQRRDPVLCLAIAECCEKRLDRGSLAPALHQQEVVVLGRERQESEPVHPRHRLDGDAP